MRKALLLAACVVLTGCSWGEPVGDGFDASRMTRDVRTWRTGTLETYRRFTLDPVHLLTVEGVNMDPAVQQRIADQFHRELVVRLARSYEVVDHPGAGVLRLTVAIVGVSPGKAMGLAQARLEAVIADSVTGQPLLALRDQRSHDARIDPALVEDWEAARIVLQSWADAVDLEIERAEN